MGRRGRHSYPKVENTLRLRLDCEAIYLYELQTLPALWSPT